MISDNNFNEHHTRMLRIFFKYTALFYLLHRIGSFGVSNGCCVRRFSSDTVIGVAHYGKAIQNVELVRQFIILDLMKR